MVKKILGNRLHLSLVGIIVVLAVVIIVVMRKYGRR